MSNIFYDFSGSIIFYLRSYDREKSNEESIEKVEEKREYKTNSINVKKFEGKTVSRCYRVYEDIQKDFSKFCKENSNYKVKDIYLWHYMSI